MDYRACQNKSLPIAEKLLALGADQDVPDRHGNTPLHLCGQQGFAEVRHPPAYCWLLSQDLIAVYVDLCVVIGDYAAFVARR